ncbi:hypothetical protein [Paludisphaera rhizosphaerae]|uniref:hypothetical protein n=1 Tax=Paludisphaera rhizosphaerae TaxID=2711216 RepID=UPI0013EDAC23|nr:hypothetical protein [Paludisphaera rhizosphaerae]
MKTRIRTILVVLAPALLIGCGQENSAPTPDRADEIRLQQVGSTLRDFQLNKGRAPKSLKDLLSSPGESGGADLIASGEVVVNYNATLPDTNEAPGGSPNEDVLAYGKDVPSKGGPVLLLNRTIRPMTADEFKAASPAKPSS